jgi:hypothetical protein
VLGVSWRPIPKRHRHDSLSRLPLGRLLCQQRERSDKLQPGGLLLGLCEQLHELRAGQVSAFVVAVELCGLPRGLRLCQHGPLISRSLLSGFLLPRRRLRLLGLWCGVVHAGFRRNPMFAVPGRHVLPLKWSSQPGFLPCGDLLVDRGDFLHRVQRRPLHGLDREHELRGMPQRNLPELVSADRLRGLPSRFCLLARRFLTRCLSRGLLCHWGCPKLLCLQRRRLSAFVRKQQLHGLPCGEISIGHGGHELR